MRLAKAQLPPSVQLKKLNQKCRILRPKSRSKRSDVTLNGSGDKSNGDGGGAFIFLNVQFCDVAATNASLAGSRDAVIPALELPASFRLATFTALRDKATAAVPQLLSMDLWLDQRVGGRTLLKNSIFISYCTYCLFSYERSNAVKHEPTFTYLCPKERKDCSFVIRRSQVPLSPFSLLLPLLFINSSTS